MSRTTDAIVDGQEFGEPRACYKFRLTQEPDLNPRAWGMCLDEQNYRQGKGDGEDQTYDAILRGLEDMRRIVVSQDWKALEADDFPQHKVCQIRELMINRMMIAVANLRRGRDFCYEQEPNWFTPDRHMRTELLNDSTLP